MLGMASILFGNFISFRLYVLQKKITNPVGACFVISLVPSLVFPSGDDAWCLSKKVEQHRMWEQN